MSRSWDPDAGEPVTASQLARDAATVIGVVRDQQRVIPVTRHGKVVAVLRPTTMMAAANMVNLDDEAAVLDARTLGRRGPAEALANVNGGGTVAITHQRLPVALLIGVESHAARDWGDLDDLFADVPEPGTRIAEDATVAGPKATVEAVVPRTGLTDQSSA